MKIAISSQGPNITDLVDPRFGRAAYILVVDSDTMEFESFDNSENVRAFQGAGIQAATTVNNNGAEVLLTGYCGPKAFKVVEAGGIKVVNDVTGCVKDAISSFMAGEMEFSDSANVESHW